MMRRIGVLVPLVGASLLLLNEAAATPGKEDKQRPTVRLAVKIKEVRDLDSIDAEVRSVDKRRVRIVLGGMLPFSRWPEKLTDEERKIKEAGLKLLKDVLLEEEMSFSLEGLDLGEVLHGDLWLYAQVSKAYPWNGARPSGKDGWFSLNVNAMMLETGHTVAIKDLPNLSFPTTGSRVRKRDEYFAEAERYAVSRKLGLWRDADTAKLARRLKEMKLKGIEALNGSK
jgi:hypothetical protein